MSRISELERYCCTLYDTRDQLKRHIFERADRAFAAGDEARDALDSLERLRARQAAMKDAFLASIGGLPSTDAPLRAETVGTAQGSGYRVENVIYESRPGHYVTSNLYLPDRREERSAAVLFVSGHEYEAKHSGYYHEVCLRFVQAGLIVLAIDPIGQGERLSFDAADSANNGVIWGTREHQHFGVKCHFLGESIARYFIHDAIRAVDYLCERPEVDPARIGITGNSGGGTQTAMMMVCDDRLAAAAPATFIMNRRQYMHAGGVQDAEQVWPGLTAVGFDHEDLLLTFAPKPLLVLAVQYDFFPIEATRRTVARCGRFWDMHGKAGLLRMEEDASTHRYTDRLARAAAAFFREQLAVRIPSAPEADRVPSSPLSPLSPLRVEQLLCTRTGQIVQDKPHAKTVQDEVVARCGQLQRMRAQLPPGERRQRALEWLREKVVSPRKPCDFNVRRVFVGQADGLQAEYRLWWSQVGLMNSGYLFRSDAAVEGAAAGKRPITVGVWLGGTTRLADRWTWIRETCAAGRNVLVLNASGVGPHEPYPIFGKPAHPFFGVIHKLTDDLIWLGDSLAALRAYDIIRCVEMIAHVDFDPDEREAVKVDFHAVGRQEHVVRIAAALDARIGAIMSEAPAGSVSDQVRSERYEEEDVMSNVMPGILGYLDFDEL